MTSRLGTGKPLIFLYSAELLIVRRVLFLGDTESNNGWFTFKVDVDMEKEDFIGFTVFSFCEKNDLRNRTSCHSP